MYVDKGKELKEIKDRVELLIEKIRELPNDQQEYFLNWISHLVVKDTYEMNELSKKIITRKDDGIMLADLMMQLREEMEEEARKKGEEKGLEEGRERGLREGRANTLKKILINKLGDITIDVNERIDSMNAKQLDILEQKIFEIQKWDDILQIQQGELCSPGFNGIWKWNYCNIEKIWCNYYVSLEPEIGKIMIAEDVKQKCPKGGRIFI